jgi:hypothetical protein
MANKVFRSGLLVSAATIAVTALPAWAWATATLNVHYTRSGVPVVGDLEYRPKSGYCIRIRRSSGGLMGTHGSSGSTACHGDGKYFRAGTRDQASGFTVEYEDQ